MEELWFRQPKWTRVAIVDVVSWISEPALVFDI